MTTLIQKEWIERMPRRMMVPMYLLGSLLYYHCNVSPMTDEAFDECCRRLNQQWDSIQHPHKRFIDRASLQATTGFRVKKLPNIVWVAAKQLQQQVQEGTIYEALSPITGLSPKPATFVIRRTRSAAPPVSGNVIRRRRPT